MCSSSSSSSSSRSSRNRSSTLFSCSSGYAHLLDAVNLDSLVLGKVSDPGGLGLSRVCGDNELCVAAVEALAGEDEHADGVSGGKGVGDVLCEDDVCEGPEAPVAELAALELVDVEERVVEEEEGGRRLCCKTAGRGLHGEAVLAHKAACGLEEVDTLCEVRLDLDDLGVRVRETAALVDLLGECADLCEAHDQRVAVAIRLVGVAHEVLEEQFVTRDALHRHDEVARDVQRLRGPVGRRLQECSKRLGRTAQLGQQLGGGRVRVHVEAVHAEHAEVRQHRRSDREAPGRRAPHRRIEVAQHRRVQAVDLLDVREDPLQLVLAHKPALLHRLRLQWEDVLVDQRRQRRRVRPFCAHKLPDDAQPLPSALRRWRLDVLLHKLVPLAVRNSRPQHAHYHTPSSHLPCAENFSCFATFFSSGCWRAFYALLRLLLLNVAVFGCGNSAFFVFWYHKVFLTQHQLDLFIIIIFFFSFSTLFFFCATVTTMMSTTVATVAMMTR